MNILLAVIGFTSGIAVASGVFALISILGIVPRLCARLGLAERTYLCETMIMLGGTAGSMITVFSVPLPSGIPFLILFGVFAGIFTGTLSMALAEVLKVVPILCSRTGLTYGVAVLVLALALGKGFGTFYQLFLSR